MNRLHSRHLPVAVDRALGAARAADLDDRTDADLLDRFARYGEHPAFEVLLRRHGPVVHGVCRRMLANPADADDAFQATFLVLVRRARAVRGERLGPWLYGVAVRVSLKARTRAARSAARQTEATDMIPDPTPPAEPADWLPVLDAELAAIPAKYREPMVLCELQGLTRAAAAQALGIPEGTLSSRLARGRELLRRRLLRHGTLLPAGGLAALMTGSGVGRSAVPVGLLARTAELVAGAGTAGVVPAGPARLMDEVIKDMFLTKLRTAGGMALAVGLLAAGLLAAAPTAPPDQPGEAFPPRSVAQVPPAGPDPKPRDPTPAADPAARPAPATEQSVQGYWKLEKCELPPKLTGGADAAKELELLVKHTWLLVDGDTWWLMMGGNAERHVVTLDPHRNPKWIDSPTLKEANVTRMGIKGIYRQPDADTLEFCTNAASDQGLRPAEFAADDDLGSCVFRFKRAALPAIPADRRPAREKLLGVWVAATPRPPMGDAPARPTRVEFTPHFVFLSEGLDSAAFTYDLDTDKNPCWIDLIPTFTDPPKDVPAQKPLLGSYQLNENGSLKVVLGEGVKRIARPLEFVENSKANVRVLDLVREGKRQPPTADPPAAPVGIAPPEGLKPQPATEHVLDLIRASEFTKARTVVVGLLEAEPTGPDATLQRLLFGICMLQEATGADPERQAALRKGAIEAFERVAADTKAGKTDRDVWLWTQAKLHAALAHLHLRQPDAVLRAASEVVERRPGTVDELIALSLAYHAHRLAGREDVAVKDRERMAVLYAKLRDKPGAFPATSGEYSREYWETVWFPAEAVKP
jgi:RNA polymerase sigma factor (sigma-70 family)